MSCNRIKFLSLLLFLNKVNCVFCYFVLKYNFGALLLLLTFLVKYNFKSDCVDTSLQWFDLIIRLIIYFGVLLLDLNSRNINMFKYLFLYLLDLISFCVRSSLYNVIIDYFFTYNYLLFLFRLLAFCYLL